MECALCLSQASDRVCLVSIEGVNFMSKYLDAGTMFPKIFRNDPFYQLFIAEIKNSYRWEAQNAQDICYEDMKAMRKVFREMCNDSSRFIDVATLNKQSFDVVMQAVLEDGGFKSDDLIDFDTYCEVMKKAKQNREVVTAESSPFSVPDESSDNSMAAAHSISADSKHQLASPGHMGVSAILHPEYSAHPELYFKHQTELFHTEVQDVWLLCLLQMQRLLLRSKLNKKLLLRSRLNSRPLQRSRLNEKPS